MTKLNCWQYCNCGREPGGERVKDLGICPVALATSLNGVNGGINGGRICWAVAGTFSPYKRSQMDCHRAKALRSCLECDFHKRVLEEEGLAVGTPYVNPALLEIEI